MKSEKIQGVYQIKNNINNKLYVGSSINIKNRWNQHKNKLITNSHTNNKLQKDWNEYGQNGFEFSILEIVNIKEDLASTEQRHLNHLNCVNNGYNIQKYVVRKDSLKKKINNQNICFKKPQYRNNKKIINGYWYHWDGKKRISLGVKEDYKTTDGENKAKIALEGLLNNISLKDNPLVQDIVDYYIENLMLLSADEIRKFRSENIKSRIEKIKYRNLLYEVLKYSENIKFEYSILIIFKDKFLNFPLNKLTNDIIYQYAEHILRDELKLIDENEYWESQRGKIYHIVACAINYTCEILGIHIPSSIKFLISMFEP